MTTPCRVRAFLAGLAFLAGALAPLAPTTARAEGLQRYTGYANPGTPSDVIKPDGTIISAADEPRAFGGSIYFMVLDRGEGRGNDTWGTRIKEFDQTFQNGVDDALKPSPGLDRKARYLYLYQVVNDRGSKSPIHEATIRLIIDPALITSWGYFGRPAKDNKAAATGVGFTSDFKDMGKEAILPVSTEHHEGPATRAFVQNAPRHTVDHPYGLGDIKIGNAPTPVANDPEAENTGRAPVAVVLLNSANFKGAPEIHTEGVLMDPAQSRARMSLLPEGQAVQAPFAEGRGIGAVGAAFESPLAGPFSPFESDLAMMGEAVGLNAPALRPVIYATPDADGRPDSSRSPAIRAVFYDVEGDIPVRQGERSVLFGFTSNFPPMFEAARLRGSEFVKAAAVATAVAAGAANLDADASEVPTPVAFEAPGAGAPGLGAGAGSLGGGGAVSGTGGFGAGGIPGVGGGLGGGVTGGGGSTGGGTSGTGQQAQQQQQQPTPTPPTPPTPPVPPTPPTPPTPTTVIVTNDNSAVAVAVQRQQQNQQQSQLQKQSQRQSQHQNQNQNNMPGNVVPEPASFASALLGLPFLFLFLRRKKPAAAAAV